MVNSGLCRGDSPSLRNTRPISKTCSKPPTTRRFRYSSGAMRRYRSMSRALWWVTNGLAAAPPGHGVEHRRLHLDEAPVLQPAADPRNDPAAQQKRLPGSLVGPQVGVALAVAQVDVGDAPPLVAEGAPGLGQQDPGRDTLTDSSPVRVRTTSPVAPIQSPSDRRSNPSKSSVQCGAGEQLDRHRSSRGACRRPACPSPGAA